MIQISSILLQGPVNTLDLPSNGVLEFLFLGLHFVLDVVSSQLRDTDTVCVLIPYYVDTI